MDQLKNLADSRLLGGCTYCGGSEETRDHVPSRVFLDPPFPENLPVVPACFPCNNGFSRDEEYLACLIECVIAGSTDPGMIQRPRVSTILERSSSLRSRIESAKIVVDERPAFIPEADRVQNVLRKLALGHAAFELSSAGREPTSLHWWPVSSMTHEQRENFDAPHVANMLAEIGSRAVQRMLVTQITLASPNGERSEMQLIINDWIEVQEGRYRYLGIDDIGGIRVRIVLSEYLACEAFWSDQ
jgi:hypothetical protein